MFRWVIICISISIVADAQITKTSPEQRIVGGQHATSYQIPFQISLFRSGNFICGGSIISRSFILTAAHCTAKDPEPSHYMVRTGSSVTWQGGQEHLVRRVIPHERYKQLKGIIENDICVLEIYPPIAFDSKQQPVALANDAEALPAKSEVWVSGYGKSAENQPATKKLMVVKLPVIDWGECYRFYTNQKMSMTRDFICAGVKDNSLNSCQGDSGGPLYTTAKVQVGIVSWGVGCTKPLYPGAYTNVSYFKKWIIQKLAEKGEKPIFESAVRLKDFESGSAQRNSQHVNVEFGNGQPGWSGSYEPLDESSYHESNNHLPGQEIIYPTESVLDNFLGDGYLPSYDSQGEILSSLISRYYPCKNFGSCGSSFGGDLYSNNYSPYGSYYSPYSNYYSPYVSQTSYSPYYG